MQSIPVTGTNFAVKLPLALTKQNETLRPWRDTSASRLDQLAVWVCPGLVASSRMQNEQARTRG